MDNLKVAIVGGGVCGLYLAWKLSEKGYQVTLFEKKEKIGKESCSGLFSQRILEIFPPSQKLIQNQIDSTLIHFPRRTLRVKFSKKMLVMNHWELDNLLFSLAEKAGAKILLNHPLHSLPDGFDRIIGCDGPESFVRKSLHLKEPSFRLAIQGFIPEKNNSDFVETWAVKNGFIWKIPRGEETEYGIITSPRKAAEFFNNFLEKNNLKVERMKSALVPRGFIIPSHPTITLCGDAAGLTKSWSGGGVIWGLTAANVLLKNFPDFIEYKKETKKVLYTKILSSEIITKITYFLGFKAPWFFPENIKIENDFLT